MPACTVLFPRQLHSSASKIKTTALLHNVWSDWCFEYCGQRVSRPAGSAIRRGYCDGRACSHICSSMLKIELPSMLEVYQGGINVCGCNHARPVKSLVYFRRAPAWHARCNIVRWIVRAVPRVAALHLPSTCLHISLVARCLRLRDKGLLWTCTVGHHASGHLTQKTTGSHISIIFCIKFDRSKGLWKSPCSCDV